MKLAALILLMIIAFQAVQMHSDAKQMASKDKYIKELQEHILKLNRLLK